MLLEVALFGYCYSLKNRKVLCLNQKRRIRKTFLLLLSITKKYFWCLKDIYYDWEWS